MPNWVYNSIRVSGDKEELEKFRDKARQQHETRWLSEGWIRNEDGTNTKVEDKDRKVEIALSGESDLSFWNFIAPPDDKLDLYFSEANGKENKAWNWYGWNNNNWGTKWNASDVHLEHTDRTLTYSFSTAWSYPEPVFEAMVAQHPKLDFQMRSVEEQGWGAEFSGSNGHASMDASWDIPDSHADWVNLDQEDSCICSSNDDENEWYDDCPKDEKEFTIVIQKSYKVKAGSAENAYELITEQDNNPDEQMEVLTDETLVWVLDEHKNRIYPKL